MALCLATMFSALCDERRDVVVFPPGLSGSRRSGCGLTGLACGIKDGVAPLGVSAVRVEEVVWVFLLPLIERVREDFGVPPGFEGVRSPHGLLRSCLLLVKQ